MLNLRVCCVVAVVPLRWIIVRGIRWQQQHRWRNDRLFRQSSTVQVRWSTNHQPESLLLQQLQQLLLQKLLFLLTLLPLLYIRTQQLRLLLRQTASTTTAACYCSHYSATDTATSAPFAVCVRRSVRARILHYVATASTAVFASCALCVRRCGLRDWKYLPWIASLRWLFPFSIFL